MRDAHHHSLQREGDCAFHVATVEWRQGRSSHYNSFSFANGRRAARSNIYTRLGAKGGGCTLKRAVYLDGTQHGDHQTRIEHVAPNCFSREIYKGILDGESHGCSTHMCTCIPPLRNRRKADKQHAAAVGARQDRHQAPAEIFADDVKCTHGATTVASDELALFYRRVADRAESAASSYLCLRRRSAGDASSWSRSRWVEQLTPSGIRRRGWVPNVTMSQATVGATSEERGPSTSLPAGCTAHPAPDFRFVVTKHTTVARSISTMRATSQKPVP